MNSRSFAALMTLAVIISLLTTATYGQSLTTVKMAGAPVDASGTLFYAEDVGFYRRVGIDAQFTPMNNTGSIATALVSGVLDVAAMPITAVAIARDHKIPLTIIAPAAIYVSRAPTSGLIVLRSSPLRTASDLVGKTIGVLNLTSTNLYATKKWIGESADASSVHWVELPEPQMVEAMRAGRIDAAVVSEPALDIALHDGARELAPVLNAVGSRFVIGAYCTTADYARTHPEVVRRFATAILQAGKWANTNHARSAEILAKYALTQVPDWVTRATYPERIDPADVQPVLDLMHDNGAVHVQLRADDLYAAAALTQ